MNLYINDFSYRPEEKIQEFETVLKGFIDICERTRKYSFEKIYMPTDFKGREISQGFSFVSYLQQRKKDSLLHQRLNSLLANQLTKIDNDELENHPIQYVKWSNNESEFFKRALNSNVPVISFKTQIVFDNHQIDIINQYLGMNEEIVESPELLNNISDISHFQVHNNYLNAKQQQFNELINKWNAIENPIRFKERTSLFIGDFDLNNKWAKADENYRVSLANEAGRYIAELNGWQYKSHLSRRNNRKIFKALNQSAYLSIDTMHCTFEVHNRKGIHCFEINFEGTKLENAQDRHNIKI